MEGIVEQINLRLEDVNMRMNSIETRMNSLESSLNSRMTAIETRMNIQIVLTFGVWATVVGVLLAMIFRG